MAEEAVYHPSGQFPLQTLPREIRDMIYTHLFAGKAYRSIGFAPGLHNFGGLGMLHASREVRSEALPILQKEAEFRIYLRNFGGASERPFPAILSQAKKLGTVWGLSTLKAIQAQALAMDRLAPLFTARERQSVGMYVDLPPNCVGF